MKITKRAVEAAAPVPGKQQTFFYDATLKGFGLRVSAKGRKTYIFEYRNAQGRKRRYTLGRVGGMTPDQARKAARAALAAVDRGEDPAEEAQQERKGETIAEFSERYLTEHARPKKKPKSVQEDEALLRRCVLPALGRIKVNAVTRKDVSRMHHGLSKTPTQANRALSLFSKMMNLAERWGVRPDGTNPCRHVDRYRETKRERFLSSEELRRLGDALKESEGKEMPSVLLAIRLLILTGARKGEILGLQWDEVDFERQCLRLRDSKTGKKTIPLGAPALDLLANVKGYASNPHVCPGFKAGKPLVNLTKPWYRIRERAGLEDVRIHDLRHSFAASAASGGVPLAVLGSLLGHSQPQTTQRYAHLAQDARHEAMGRVSKEIAATMDGKLGEVRQLRQKGS